MTDENEDGSESAPKSTYIKETDIGPLEFLSVLVMSVVECTLIYMLHVFLPNSCNPLCLITMQLPDWIVSFR